VDGRLGREDEKSFPVPFVGVSGAGGSEVDPDEAGQRLPRARWAIIQPVKDKGAMADVFDRDQAPAAVALILAGQEPPFEGRVRERMDEARWFDSAEELVEAGVDYFGPVARKARRPLAGFSKEDVADATNVVWLDLDPPPGAGTDDGARLVAEAERWLEGLRALGLGPSVFVFSGRGCWAYWKLDRRFKGPPLVSGTEPTV
jgi:hypothetical protein